MNAVLTGGNMFSPLEQKIIQDHLKVEEHVEEFAIDIELNEQITPNAVYLFGLLNIELPEANARLKVAESAGMVSKEAYMEVIRIMKKATKRFKEAVRLMNEKMGQG